MSRRLPPLNSLRAFEAAARHLSFTRAADELGVTQAAISQQLKGLEERLRFPLFRRLNRELRLTDEGQALFPPVRDALDALADAIARLGSEAAGGPLTVSVIPSFAVKWLVPRISHFQDAHPDIDLRIAATERLSDFVRDGIDIAVRFGRGRWPGLRAELLAEEWVTPMCHPEAAARLKAPNDLAGEVLLHEEMAPLLGFPGWRAWLDAAGAAELDADRGPRFSHTHLMLQAAMDGGGVALAQTVIAADDLASGRLAAPFALRLPTGLAYYVVSPRSGAGRPKVRAFRDWILTEANPPPDAQPA